MVLVDVVHDRLVRHPVARVFRAVARWLAERRAERRRRAALQDLLFAPDHRLRDMGVTRDELIRAIERRR